MRTRYFHTVLVAAGLLIATSTPLGLAETASTARSPKVDLRWSEISKAREMPLGISKAPNRGLLTVATTNNSLGFELTRSNRHGHQTWSHTWRGPGGSYLGVTGNAVSVSRKNHAVLVAGQASCRFQGGEPGSIGPVFIRSYDLSGERQWTRWVGRCPARSADRRIRNLLVAGLDVWAGGIALAFTQGRSSDCCPHFRRGHVVALGFDGARIWQTDLKFARPKVREVLASDVAAAGHLLVVSGTLIHRRYGSDAYLVGLSTDQGSVMWRHLTNGKSETNADQFWDVDAANGAIFAAGEIDASFEGGGGQYILERWTTSGTREWRASLPSHATVAAQSDHSVMWSAPVWRQGKRDQIAFGRQRADGSSAWRDRWPLPRQESPYDYVFVASQNHGFGAADVAGHNNRWFVQTWAWRWR